MILRSRHLDLMFICTGLILILFDKDLIPRASQRQYIIEDDVEQADQQQNRIIESIRENRDLHGNNNAFPILF
jgi:hypothetical protein